MKLTASRNRAAFDCFNLKTAFTFLTFLALAVAALDARAAGEPKAAKKGAVALRFENRVDGDKLRLNDSIRLYKNPNGDDFKVTKFNYYISNLSLIDKKGNRVSVPDSYILVNAADTATLLQEIPNIPEGKYHGIAFTIGVDSARNFSGAQTGALDPARGMFWSWNTGYIYVKFEGESPKSASKNNRLTFHIGGAKAPNNTIRTFTQRLPKTLKIKAGKTPELALEVNAAALFRGKTSVDFARLSTTMGGPNAVIVADNYSEGLFKVKRIKN